MAKKHIKHHKKAKTAHFSSETSEKSETTTKNKSDFWNSKKRNEIITITILLLIAIGISTIFRMYPSDLPATKDWAQDSMRNQIANQVSAQINAQYPTLPTAQRQELINKEVDKAIEAQKETIDAQVEQSAQYFKSQLQDENNNTYLLAIDPYYWYTHAQNLEKNGFQGDTNIDGNKSFSLRDGREETSVGTQLHPVLGVLVHKIGKVFNKDFTLQRAMFILPVIIIALSIIFAFFLARKIGGNVAGFVAGLIVGLNSSLLGRTPAGFSDTDAYIIMGPLLVAWTFLEAMMAKSWKNKIIWTMSSVVSMILFQNLWQNWWYIGSLLVALLGIHLVYTLIVNKEWTNKKLDLKQKLLNTGAGKTISLGVLFIVSFMILNGLVGVIVPSISGGFIENAIKPVKLIFAGPLMALTVKNVAAGSNIWPNVLTTVAELNPGSWAQVVGSVGGKLFFTIGIIGVLLTFFLKNENNKPEIRYAALLTMWFVGLAIMGVIAARFIALLAAPFAIAFGAFFGILWMKGSKWLKLNSQTPILVGKIILAIIIIALFLLPVKTSPIKTASIIAKGEIPSMNDAWVNSLTAIKNNSTDAIITSWWDFGHWFVNVAERRVTFDGGDQGKRIYWVGKSLMTEDMQENKDIIRMLNCGQNRGYEIILEYTNNSYLATKTINEIIHLDSNEAKEKLSNIGLNENQIEEVLGKTHCSNDELIDQYYIASQDMVGKAGVWAHFGSWNFDRAYVYNTFKNNKYEKAMETLIEKSPYTEDELTNMYYEIQTLTDNRAVDTWIASWPSYVTSSAKNCIEDETKYTCALNQVIGNQQNGQIVMENAIIPKDNPQNTQILIGLYSGSQKLGQGDSIQPKELSIITNNGTNTYQLDSNQFPYELAIAKTPKGIKAIVSDPIMGSGTFSRLFFFEGVGMEGYEKISDITDFTGQRIIVYKVDLDN